MLPKIEAVECCTCKSLHKLSSNDFITIYGNIMIGESGGIVGNNFSREDNTKLITSTVFCKPCFFDLAKKLFQEELY